MSEAQRELMRVQKYLRQGDKISTVNAVAIGGALNDAFAEGFREGIEQAAKAADGELALAVQTEAVVSCRRIAAAIRTLKDGNEGEG